MSEHDLPSRVLTEIGSPVKENRLTGVDELARIAAGDTITVAAAARDALMRLAEDDSRSVSAAAVAALERTAVRVRPDRVDFGQVPAGTPQLLADVFVGGPPLAVATTTVTVSGPGLRAMMVGRRLRILWLPESDWLDGSVTVHGPAGWADVRVTGQVAAAEPVPRAEVENQLRTGMPGTRLTVLPPEAAPAPAHRRRRGARGTVLIAGFAAFVLLGGAGVAMAMTRAGDSTAAAPPPAEHQHSTSAEGLAEAPAGAPLTVAPGPLPTLIDRVPLARGIKSVGRPVVVATIRVGAEPEGVAVSPDHRTVYVANQNSHVLSVIDARTRKVTPVKLRSTPRFVAVSGDGDKVFASMYEDDRTGSGLAVIDARTRRVERYVTTGVQPYALAVGPDNRVWVPIHSQRMVELYAVSDQRPDGRILVPPNPHAVAFSTEFSRAFTPNHESNAVAVIDMRDGSIVGSVPVSTSPHHLAVSPDGKVVLVAGYDAGTADLIDARTLRRSGPFKVGAKPQSVAFATDGAHAYVVNEGDGTVSVVDGHTGEITATVRVGGSPRSVAVSPDGSFAYVTNGADDTVSVLRVGE
ncbi:cytochrome D1 domain-containing protein [Actinoplanes sp. NPDC051494]|uniref:cytochrome D1 domain-containing protein n=1 Tax=Actinoplanes sp. NPDC051494 TaxID=3363907 RepID=UPI003798056E